MINLFKKKPAAGRTYAEVIKLSQQDGSQEFSMGEKWIIGCYKYYRTLLDNNENKQAAEKWWSGCVKSYNNKIK
jgi:hypothetical protein